LSKTLAEDQSVNQKDERRQKVNSGRAGRGGKMEWFCSRMALGIVAAVAAAAIMAVSPARASQAASDRCRGLEGRSIAFAGDTARIVEARFNPDNAAAPNPGPAGPTPVTLPAHCEIKGVMHERVGQFGQRYAIHFHMRLPAAWNDRLVFQGGGGSDGDLGDALGHVSSSGPVAAAMGYAVVSQDAGHDNATNSDPAHNGVLGFGFDPAARRDYGHTSLKASADAAKAVIEAYYGRRPRYSYFVGCSKGGQEGMTFAQYYPDEFDGIVAGAPGFSLPRAAVAEAWDVQAMAGVLRAGQKPVTVGGLAGTFSNAELGVVRQAILAACDADDGLADGIVGDFTRCTDDKVLPQLEKRRCAQAAGAACLTDAQIAALTRIVRGARNGEGQPLYAGWYWPSGIAGGDWRLWKIGSEDGRVPPLNVVLGGAALASVFTTPPTVLGDPPSMLNYQLGFDFDRDAEKIYAVAPPFTESAWADIGSRSTDLSAFKARGGRLIVPQGESDPVFSLKDTLDWFEAVNRRNNGRAADFARVFPVPGMCHCGGGQATDQYDLFSALVAWVEHGKAPDAVVATAGQGSPWPGRQRPLCVYPEIAAYIGGDKEKAASFACRVRS
jgi:feruloyl esterase